MAEEQSEKTEGIVHRDNISIIYTLTNSIRTANAYPLQGPGEYHESVQSIISIGKKSGLPIRLATGEESASFVEAIYCMPDIKNSKEGENTRAIINEKWLWVPNINVQIPANARGKEPGIYIIHDARGAGRSHEISISMLEKAISGGIEIMPGVFFSRDGKIRFASKGKYKAGEHTPDNLAKDGFVVASYGVEGADKLARVSREQLNGQNPYIWIKEIPVSAKPVQSNSAITGYRGQKLYIDSGREGRSGYSSGILG